MEEQLVYLQFLQFVLDVLRSNLQTIGISFQLIAGLILASPFVFSQKPFKRIDGFLKNSLAWPSTSNLRLILVGFVVATASPIFVLILVLLWQGEREWPKMIAYALLTAPWAAFLYMIIVYSSLVLCLKIKAISKNLRRTYLLSFIVNIIALVVVILIFYVSLLGAISLVPFFELELTQTIKRLLNIGIIFLMHMMQYSVLSWFSASAFIVVTLGAKVISLIASPIKRPFWVLVLSAYGIGGSCLLLDIYLPR